jgi:flagellin
MGLRINTNIEAIQIHGQLVDSGKHIADSLRKLSSGKRIVSAKDDAAGYTVANKFRSDISCLRVAYQNASEAQSLLSLADGSYNKIHDILVRMKDLATQAASGQTPTGMLNSEFQLLQSEIDRIANSTKYSPTALINQDQNMTFQVGQQNGTDFQLTIGLKGATSTHLGVNAAVVDITDTAHAQSAMDLLDTALSSINGYMGTVGAYQTRLQYTMENLAATIENFSASESSIRDVDMALEVTNFTKDQILQQSGMAMLAQANAAPQQILSLLRG